MEYRFLPPVQNLQNNSDANNVGGQQTSFMPLQGFSVPPPPIPPPLSLLPPPVGLSLHHCQSPQYYNIPDQLLNKSSVPPFQSHDSYNSVDPFVGMMGSSGVERHQLTSELQNNSKKSRFLQVSEDEMWVKNWLSKKETVSSDSGKSSSPFKVHQAKECLKDCIFKLHQLKSVEHRLLLHIKTMDSLSWDSAMKDIQLKAAELGASLSKFDNPRIVEELKKTLMKRKKKRESQKNRYLHRREMCMESLIERQQLHRSIDSWLKDMEGAVEKAKMDESLKKEADNILSDVTRKKSEARRQLALLSALLKLQQLRVKMAASQGHHISAEPGVRFCKVTDHLRKLWDKQLKEYNLEEQGLRLMLSDAVDERDQTRIFREKQNLKRWEQLLFGGSFVDIPDFYNAAQENLEAFVNIRQQWDEFVSSSDAPMSSAIPIGWVLPTMPSSNQWETIVSSSPSVE